MSTSKITSKGQITIPLEICLDLHVGPGDRVEFIKVEDGRYEMMAATQNVNRLRGVIKTSKKVSIDEMDAAIRAKAGK